MRDFADLRKEAGQATDRKTHNEKIVESGNRMSDSRRSRSQGNKLANELGLETCSTPLF